MAEMLDDVAYLSQEIGPRPAGTEEEQQAALYIADQVHERTNLKAEIEDIKCCVDGNMLDFIYFGVGFLSVLLSLVVSGIGIVTLIVSILCAVCFYIEEYAHRPLLGKVLSRDISQNIVVRYEPETLERSASRRKIVIVANYDSGRVKRDLRPNSVKLVGHAMSASYIAILVAPVILLFKDVVFVNALGFVGGFFTILAVVDAVLLLVPIVKGIIERTGAYNEAANVNASGIAVLLNLIRRVDGSVKNEPMATGGEALVEDESVIYGAEAVRAAGVVPDGAELVYEQPNRNDPMPAPRAGASETIPMETVAASVEPAAEPISASVSPSIPQRPVAVPEEQQEPEESATERLRAAKAAIAALTGDSVSEDIYAENLEEKVSARATTIAVPDQEEQARQRAEMRDAFTGAAGDMGQEESASTQTPEAADLASEEQQAFTSEEPPVTNKVKVPDWYISAQQKAKRPAAPANGVHRSRYADALDSAVKESEAIFDQANRLVDSETEARLSNMRRGISEVKPPYLQDGAADDDARIQSDEPTQNSEAVEAALAAAPVEPAVPAAQIASPAVPTQSAAPTVQTVMAAPMEPATPVVPAKQPVPTPEPQSAAAQPASISAPASAAASAETQVQPAEPQVQAQPASAPASVETSIPTSTSVAPAAPQEQAVVPAESAVPTDKQPEPVPASPVVESPVTNTQIEAPAVRPMESEVAPAAQPVPAEAAPASERIADAPVAKAPERTASFAGIPEAPVMEVAPVDMPDFLNGESNRTISEVPLEPVQQSTSDDALETQMPFLYTSSARFVQSTPAPAKDESFDDENLGETIAMSPIQIPDSLYPEKPAESLTQVDSEPPSQPRVKLPEVPNSNMAPITETAKQRAPLAQATEQGGKSAAKSLLSHRLPKIDAASLSGDLGEPISDGNEKKSAASKQENLMQNLPSLSGSISSETKSSTDRADKVVSATGSFSAISASGSVAPVGDELVADVDPDDLYIDDADDSIRQGGITESGAFAGPDYVDMPKSRRGRFFGRFRRKKHEEEASFGTPQQWLDVDDGFDARSVGQARGDWSSFQEGNVRGHAGDRRNDSHDTYYDAPYDGYETYDANDGDVPNSTYGAPQQSFVGEYEGYYDEYADDGYYDDDDDRWRGGAFSGRRSSEDRGVYETGHKEPEDLYMDIPDDGYFPEQGEEIVDEPVEEKASRFGKLKGRVSRKGKSDDKAEGSRGRNSRRGANGGRPVSNSSPARPQRVAEELKQVYEFADVPLDNEVWFVALGAGESNNAGIRQFIDAHREELRGAIVVNIEALGAGTLGFASIEGGHKKRMPTTRLKRYLHTASTAAGITLQQSDQTWRDSAAVVAMDAGLQAVSIIGLDGDKPALYAQSDDVVENMDEALLQENANFVMEFLKAF